MKKRLFAVLALMMVAAFLFAGCSSAPAPSSYSYGNGSKAEAAPPDVAREPAAQASSAPAATSAQNEGLSADVTGDTGLDTESILQPGVNRKVIYTGTIEAETKKFDDDYNKIMSSLRADGGYVQNASINGTKPENYGDSGRSATMSLRVPSAKFDSFMDMLNGIGKNKKSEISGQDISLTYYDTEQQLETLRTRQQRLQDLMKNPNYSLTDLIQVEKELSDVSSQIQQLESQKRDYDSLIDFSTVNITLSEINTIELKTVPAPQEDLGTQISNGFFGVLNVLAEIGRGLLIIITAGSPVLLLIAIITVGTVLLVKHSNKKKQKKGGYPPYPPQQGGQNNGQNKI